MPDCDMDKIIVHWTAGAYACSAVDKEHYHIIVDGDGKLWRGDKSIKANVSTSDNDGYAAHTKNCNTKSIGVSACCMANAVESPFNPGNYPLKPIQWDTLAEVVAELATKYNIKCTPTTIMQHGEVQDNLGIAQDGKWDIMKLPWDTSLSGEDVGEQFRDKVADLM
jgi:N-acetyl-anhydromuramyl-L-alanine amidase AmpD